MAVKPSTSVAMTRKGEKTVVNKINRFQLAKLSANKADLQNAQPDDNSAIQYICSGIPLYYQCSCTT